MIRPSDYCDCCARRGGETRRAPARKPSCVIGVTWSRDTGHGHGLPPIAAWLFAVLGCLALGHIVVRMVTGVVRRVRSPIMTKDCRPVAVGSTSRPRQTNDRVPRGQSRLLPWRGLEAAGGSRSLSASRKASDHTAHRCFSESGLCSLTTRRRGRIRPARRARGRSGRSPSG